MNPHGNIKSLSDWVQSKSFPKTSLAPNIAPKCHYTRYIPVQWILSQWIFLFYFRQINSPVMPKVIGNRKQQIIQSIGKYIPSCHYCEILSCNPYCRLFSQQEFIHLCEPFLNHEEKQLDRQISCWNRLQKEFPSIQQISCFLAYKQLDNGFFPLGGCGHFKLSPCMDLTCRRNDTLWMHLGRSQQNEFFLWRKINDRFLAKIRSLSSLIKEVTSCSWNYFDKDITTCERNRLGILWRQNADSIHST